MERVEDKHSPGEMMDMIIENTIEKKDIPVLKEESSFEDATIDNLELPKSIVLRLAKGVLPEGTLIQKDAKQVLTRVATYFVSYLGATIIESATAVTASPKTKPGDKTAPLKVTITPEAIQAALRAIDFDNFIKPLNVLMAEKRKKNPITVEEVEKLNKRFSILDRKKTGKIKCAELLSLEGMTENPLAPKILALFDKDSDGYIDFAELLSGLSTFARKSTPISKLSFIFSIYDINSDGYISNGDLFLALRMMTGEQLSDVQLQQIVDRTIREADTDEDGRISLDEFKLFVAMKNGDIIHQIKTDIVDY